MIPTKMHSVESGIESRGMDIHAGWHPAVRKKKGEVRIIFGRNKRRKKMLNSLDFIGEIWQIRLRVIVAHCEGWQSFLFQKSSHALAYMKKKL